MKWDQGVEMSALDWIGTFRRLPALDPALTISSWMRTPTPATLRRPSELAKGERRSLAVNLYLIAHLDPTLSPHPAQNSLGQESFGDPVSGMSSLALNADAHSPRLTPAWRKVLPAMGLAILPAIAAAQTNFGAVSVGSSTSVSVTVTIPAAATLASIAVVTEGAPNLDFTNAGGGTCSIGTDYAAMATCTVSVTFSPIAAGTRYGAVVLASSSGVVATGYLEGTGQAAQTTFLPGAVSKVAGGFNCDPGTVRVAVDAAGSVFISLMDLHDGPNGDWGVYKETLAAGKYTQTTVTSVLAQSVAIDGSGSLYVSTGGGSLKFTPFGGAYTASSVSYGEGGVLAVDAGGNVYVPCANGGICVASLAFGQYTYMKAPFGSGLAPVAMAIDGSGNVYISTGDTLYKETPANGSYTQTTILHYTLASVPVVDGLGNLYVALFSDPTDDSIESYKLTPTDSGYMQTPIGADLTEAAPMAVDAQGNVYFVEYSEGGGEATVYKLDLADPPALSFAATYPGATSSDSPKTITVSNLGNEPLAFSAVSYPANFPEASGVESDCNSSTSLAGGVDCTLSINFTPEAALTGGSARALSGSVTVATNTQNTTGTSQLVAVSGSETNAPAVNLTALPNPARFGAAVTFKASVTGMGTGAPAPTGTVTFYFGRSSLGSAALSSGVATLTTSKLTPGKDSITAAYSGDANYAALASAALTEIVNKLTPAIKLVSSANPGKVERSIRFTAEVTGANGILPAGTVEFYSGTKLLGTGTLSKGATEFSAKLAAGKYTITARYAGDADLNAAASAPLAEVVDKLVPTVKLAASANPATVGSTVTFKATVTGSGTTPAGTVVFKSGTKTLGTVTLSDGKAAYSTSKLAAGTYSITASYSGSAAYAAEKSAPLKEKIDK
jgi:hypothetical protein